MQRTSVSDFMEVELERASNIPENGVDVHLFALFPLVFDNCEMTYYRVSLWKMAQVTRLMKTSTYHAALLLNDLMDRLS